MASHFIHLFRNQIILFESSPNLHFNYLFNFIIFDFYHLTNQSNFIIFIYFISFINLIYRFIILQSFEQHYFY